MMQKNLATASAADREEILYWLALRMTPGLGTRKAWQLLDVFRTPQGVFRASRSELEGAGIAPAVAQSIASGCAFEDAADQQQKMQACGAELIDRGDPRYPAALKEIYDPPPVLYARGRTELLGAAMLGVVGTRRPTAYGTAVAARLARELAGAGLAIVSGMARGIDTAAHRAVLDAGGDTIAVFGCGADEVYPAENRKLAEEIATKGLILSEFPMGAPPYPQNFPIRNRIISGMSAGILVIEGSQYSGSAITAKLAAEQNRPVFAVPGNITSRMSWGPNLLIKQGAKLVQEWNDVVTDLDADIRRWLAAQRRNQLIPEENEADATGGGGGASDEFGPKTAVAQAVLRSLSPDSPTTLDQLIDGLDGCSPSEVMAVLFELELGGVVRQLPGKSYIRVWVD